MSCKAQTPQRFRGSAADSLLRSFFVLRGVDSPRGHQVQVAGDRLQLGDAVVLSPG